MSIASVSHSQVFGIKQDIKDNLYSVDDDTILFPAGSNVIVMQKTHKRFIPVSEKSEAITAITISPDRHLLAIAEKSSKPSICIFDISSARRRRQLTAYSETCLSKEFSSLSFSSDSKYLLAQLSHPDWMLHYYAWDKGKLIATISSAEGNQKVLQVSVNPLDGTVIFVLGDTFLRLYRYAEGEMRNVDLAVPSNTVRNLPYKDFSIP